MFLKLTDPSENTPVWINMDNVVYFKPFGDNEGSYLQHTNDGGYYVKETPERIVQILELHEGQIHGLRTNGF